MENYAVKPMMLYVIGEVSFPVGELKTIAFDMNSATGQAFRINQATAGVKARDVSRYGVNGICSENPLKSET